MKCGREFEERSVCPVCRLNLVSFENDNAEKARMERPVGLGLLRVILKQAWNMISTRERKLNRFRHFHNKTLEKYGSYGIM